MTLAIFSPVVEPTQVGFLVTGDWCDRCGDQNYDGETRVCLTCTYPDDPCSRAYLDQSESIPDLLAHQWRTASQRINEDRA
jgi:ribosomal protein L37E